MTKSLVQKNFGAAAADYAASAVHANGPSLARVVELVAPQSHWRALDVATGAGHTAIAFAPHVSHVVASDITAEMLQEAQKVAASKGLANVDTKHAEAGALPFPDASFDFVTCRLAAHHFPDVVAFVDEVWRVLVPGGTFALVDNVSPDVKILPDASDAELRDLVIIYNAFEKLRDPSHGSCLTLSEWLKLEEKCGFVIAHREHIDQEVPFDAWTARMRCDEATVNRLRAALQDQPLKGFLRPHTGENGFAFTLQEAIILARKPVQE
jgi:ubiquinone/menaquinone biosynthesis C-methylase UbiE